MSHEVPMALYTPTEQRQIRATAIQAACVLASRKDLLTSYEQLALAFRFATVIAEYVQSGKVGEL